MMFNVSFYKCSSFIDVLQGSLRICVADISGCCYSDCYCNVSCWISFGGHQNPVIVCK